jgi:hypothetical protein
MAKGFNKGPRDGRAKAAMMQAIAAHAKQMEEGAG